MASHISPVNSKYGGYDGSSQIQLELDRINRHISSFTDFQKQTEKMNEAADRRFDAIEAKLDSIFTMLGQTTPPQQTPIATTPPFSSSPIQVSSLQLEQNRKKDSLGYRFGQMNVADCDSMLEKIEMPVFSGQRPYVWITEAERFFDFESYSAEERLDLASLSLTGKARNWYWSMHKGFKDWSDFKRKLVLRFSVIDQKKESNSVIDQATNLQQTKSSIVENNDEASQNCDSKVINLNKECEFETAGSDMAIGCVVQPQILISDLEPCHSFHKLAMETDSLLKEKGECQEIDSIYKTHLKAVQEEESFSQMEATKMGSLIQEGDALDATESLVKDVHTANCCIQRPFSCVRRWIIQIETHLWHRWKHKIEILEEVSELVLAKRQHLLKFTLEVKLVFNEQSILEKS